MGGREPGETANGGPQLTYTARAMAVRKHPLRLRFEEERRRSAFMAFLPAAGTGIIAADTWLSHWFGVPGGLLAGAVAYVLVWSYESYMWRRENG